MRLRFIASANPLKLSEVRRQGRLERESRESREMLLSSSLPPPTSCLYHSLISRGQFYAAAINCERLKHGKHKQKESGKKVNIRKLISTLPHCGWADVVTKT